ncbi:titin homolog [Ixodes scapularis]
MEKTPDPCSQCNSWETVYASLKRKIFDTSLLIEKYKKVNDDNGCLNKKVAELNILSQSLRADCTRYEQELCNALQEQEPLKQRCASLQAETAQHKIQKTALETTLESCKATIKQYEALLEAGEANEKPAKGPRGRPKKEDKEKVTALEKELRESRRAIRQMQSKCKKALTCSKVLAEKVSGKDLINKLDKRQLNRVVTILATTMASQGEDGVGESDDGDREEDADDCHLGEAAEYLEQLLANGNGAEASSDSDGELCSIHSASADELSPKKRSSTSDSRKRKESVSKALASDSESKQCKVVSPAKSEEPGATKFQDATSKRLFETEDDRPTNADGNSLGLDGNSMEQERSKTPPDVDKVSETQQPTDMSEQQQQQMTEPDTGSSSIEMSGGQGQVESESELDGVKVSEVTVPLDSESGAEPTETLLQVPQTDALGGVAEADKGGPGDQNKSKKETPQGNHLEVHKPEVVVGADAEAPPLQEVLSVMGPSQILPDKREKEPNAKAVKSKESLVKDAVEDGECDMRVLKAELSHMTREMCLKDIMMSPLSPLPPSPPPFVDENPLDIFSSQNESRRENASFASTSRSIQSSPPKKKRKHRDKTLPFSSQNEETSSTSSSAREHRRRFLHQESEGFEPHVGNMEEQYGSRDAGSSSLNKVAPSNQSLSTKFSWHPINKSIHVAAKFPRESLAKPHVMPTITIDVDVKEFDFHMTFSEVPLDEAQTTQTSSGIQDHGRPEFVSARVEPTVHQDQPFVRHLPTIPRPVTTPFDSSGFRAPLPRRRTIITPASNLNRDHTQRYEAVLPFGSCSLDSAPEEAIDSLVPQILNESASLARRPLISPLPPSPQKPGGSSGEPSASQRRFGRSHHPLMRQSSSVPEAPPNALRTLRPEKRRSSFGFRVASSTIQRGTEGTGDLRTMADIPEEEQVKEVPLGRKRRISLLSTKAAATVSAVQLPKTSAVTTLPEQDHEDSAQNVPEEGNTAPSVLTRRQRMRMLFASDSSSDDEKPGSSKTTPVVSAKEPSSNSVDPPSLPGQAKSVATSDNEVFAVPTAKRRRLSRLASRDTDSPLEATKGLSLPSPHSPEPSGLDASVEKGAARPPKFTAIPYSIYVTTQDHHTICLHARGSLNAATSPKQALEKLAWLAAQPQVNTMAVPNIARGIRGSLDHIVLTTLIYLGNTTANPLLAYHRREQSVPLLTHMESLMLDCFEQLRGKRANVANLFNGLLSALRVRLASPRRPKTLLGQASFVRVVSAVCKQLGELSLARVFVWDLLRGFQGNAIFLVAAAVGVWPEILSSLRPEPRTEAVCLAYRHLLFHAPHTLNLTLLAQAHAVLREVGDIHPLDEAPTVEVVAEKLFDSLKRAAEQPATPENAAEKKDLCLMHCLAFEEVCKRSEPWQWCLDFALGKLVWPTLLECIAQRAEGKAMDLALCLAWLLGDIWKYCPVDSVPTLRPFVDKLVELLTSDDTEFALQETVVRSLLKLPSLDQQEAVLSAVTGWQQRHRDTLVQIPHFAKARVKFHKSAKKARKKREKKRPAQPQD